MHSTEYTAPEMLHTTKHTTNAASTATSNAKIMNNSETTSP